MRFKALLLAIPVLIVLAATILLDKPITYSGEESTDEAVAIEPITLNLVIGKTGSLYDDPGEPIYSEPDENSEEITKLQYNCCVLQSEPAQSDIEWVAVDLPNTDSTGYIKKENVDLETHVVECTDQIRYEIVKAALSNLGAKFKMGKSSLTDGIDCSNFINQMYESAGVNIPKVPNEIRDVGYFISQSEAKPGDGMYYNVNNGNGHVAIYLGGDFQIGSMGHSGKIYPKGGVRICRLIYRDRENPEFINLLN